MVRMTWLARILSLGGMRANRSFGSIPYSFEHTHHLLSRFPQISVRVAFVSSAPFRIATQRLQLGAAVLCVIVCALLRLVSSAQKKAESKELSAAMKNLGCILPLRWINSEGSELLFCPFHQSTQKAESVLLSAVLENL